ncbi:enterobactin synthase subunit F [Cronobacter turicensis]|nr:enterobactin synthase subunit F [Cronobacter turicensis]ELQ6271645.1 enterobactin synthase subunit F [Cronobacter turicensis]
MRREVDVTDITLTQAEHAIDALPLVAAQPGIWMAEKLSNQNNAWSVAHYVELNGALDAPLLARAIVAGMMEADTLRMRFEERDGIVTQRFDASLTFVTPEMTDLRREACPQTAALALMHADLEQDLRVTHGKPLAHHLLLQVGETRWLWYQRYHHLVVDGFSFTAITRRIADVYRSLHRGEQPDASPFVPFKEVVDEYACYQASDACARDAAFWAQQVRELPPPATLSDQPLTGHSSTTSLIRRSLRFDAAPFAALMANSGGLAAPDVALALVALWLGRLSGRDAYSAGFIFMRRIGSAALCATGPVLNVLPCPVRIDPAQTLAQFAAAFAKTLKTLRRHQRYDAEQVLRDAGKVAQQTPLYGPVLNLKMFDYRLDFDGVEGITHQLASGPVKDLEIALYVDDQGGVTLELLANQQRYEAPQIERHLARLPRLLTQFAADPGLACAQADLLDESDYALMARVNQTAVQLPLETLSSLLAKQAQATPNAPALADARYAFTYREMREQVLTLAAELARRGVKPGDVVAVALPRSVFLSLALQAIVEAGAAWLPLDTGYPDDRLQMMLEDARPALLITAASEQGRFTHLPLSIFCYDAPLPVSAAQPLSRSHPAHTAYVIFTSGSTGRPKGVMVGQTAIVNRLLWMQHQYPLGADDVVLQKTPCSFDVSVWEFFWPLIVGARLVMAPPEAHRDPQALQALFVRWRVTTTHFVPSMLAAFVGALTSEAAISACASLRQVFCSGEALPTELCREWERLTAAPLHNLYGPTEAAVDVSGYPAFGAALAQVKGASVPIGFPVWNTGLRILDSLMRPVPPGMAGDLYLTGVQLAQGYLGRPDLTASRFIADPFAAGERMYRTGDVARWLPDGAVEYLGRSDDQLKIRGQRIEPGEIDRVMQSLPDVAQAVTHACVLNHHAETGGDARQLVGYVVSASGDALDVAALRARLSERLPAHMVPVTLLQLPALPLSANGKLDRKALPLPQLAARAPGRTVAPGMETAIACAFSELLGVEVTDAQADFFALGGHSLLAMRLAARLTRERGRAVTVGQVMIAPTVEKLAAVIEAAQSDAQAEQAGFDAILPLREGRGPTLFCFHPASGFAWQFSVLQRWLSPRWAITGIQSPRPDGPMQQCASVDELCDRHYATLREQQPHGPYWLFGYSLGGTIAHGVAARLQAAGEEVAFLGLLDTWPPETQNWQEKGGRELDPAVLAEIERERAAFVSAQQGQGSHRLFETIEGNYADAVRLLSTARSARFEGDATLFVAERTVTPGLDPFNAWAPWTRRLEVHNVDCAHVEIISPQAFEVIGPVLRDILG